LTWSPALSVGYESAGPDLARVACLVKEGPGIAGVVFIVEIRGDVHQTRTEIYT